MSCFSAISNFWNGDKAHQNIALEVEEVDLEKIEEGKGKEIYTKKTITETEKLIKPRVDDDSDDEVDNKKANKPSTLKQITAIALSASAALATNYFDCNPIITVGAAALFSSAGKTVLRNISIKYRYPLVVGLTALGFVADYYNPINLNVGPICATLLFSCLSRTQKLYLLGKLSKDL